MNDLKNIVKDWSILNTMDISHTIFLIRRIELPPQHLQYLQQYTVEPITHRTSHTLSRLFMEAKQEQRIDLYQTFTQVPNTRILAGFAYEMIGHHRFQSKVEFSLTPMAKELPTQKKKNVVWLSQFPRELVGTIAFNFTPQTFMTYKWPGPKVVKPFIYYIPESSNQVAFDSFVLVDQVLYMFQFTIASTHPIKAGIMGFLSHLRETLKMTREELRFVFVIPPGNNVGCTQTSDDLLKGFWNSVKLYSTVMDPEEQKKE
jgi:hypothetical protein